MELPGHHVGDRRHASVTARAATYPDLAGSSVFITGGASGIGASLVQGFVEQGAKVASIDLEEPEIDGALFIQGDVTDIGALQSAMDAAAEAHGPVTVLVNNAAQDTRFNALEVTPEDWDAQQDVNLKHYFFASQHAANGMIAAGLSGAIVNMSSIVYLMPASGLAPYTVANAAISGMTRTLSQEWGHHGIRVNAVAPGMVLTERQLRDWITPEDRAAMQERQALKIEMRADDMVGPVVFLASRNAHVITGQCLVADAGVV